MKQIGNQHKWDSNGLLCSFETFWSVVVEVNGEFGVARNYHRDETVLGAEKGRKEWNCWVD